MLNVMYDLPSLNNATKVVIDENCIKEKAEPLIIFENEEVIRSASE